MAQWVLMVITKVTTKNAFVKGKQDVVYQIQIIKNVSYLIVNILITPLFMACL